MPNPQIHVQRHRAWPTASPLIREITNGRPWPVCRWLKAYSGYPVIPTNFDTNFARLNKQVRKHFELSHDETRHSFISYHVAIHRSVGDAALQAGNSEAIVKKNSLNLRTREEGGKFFRIVPDMKKGVAVFAPAQETSATSHLKVVCPHGKQP